MTAISTLAIDGGVPVRTEPLPPWPFFDQEQVDAAAEVLTSGRVNYWTGFEGRAFEDEFARFCGVSHALTAANGTVALELIVRAMGLGPGVDVIVAPRTFIASAACVVGVGARPVFADVDRDSQVITPEAVEAALTPQTKAILAVHLAGWPVDMPGLLELAEHHGLDVIEDCAQAHGATIDGRPVGSFGRAAAFSFCQDKIITTGGEGGMVVTDDTELWRAMWSYRDHGKDYNEVHRNDHPPGFRWVHRSFGSNGRMTEMQSALGRIQLRRLPEWLAIRRRNAAILDEVCEGFPALRVTKPPAGFGHAYYKHYVFVRPERLAPGWNRDRIMAALAAEGVPSYSGSCPEVYLEKAFDGLATPEARLPVAAELGETSLMFMVHPTLTADDMADVAAAVTKVMSQASA